MAHEITEEVLEAFRQYLISEEKGKETVEKYLRDMRAFSRWLDARPVDKERTIGWKEHLLEEGYSPRTVNTMLSAANALFGCMGWTECRVKFLRIQHRTFREPERELNRQEYFRLVRTASAQKKERLALLMETICATGIRVSEVKYITVEAAKNGRADIFLKGKVRSILIPGKLCRKLLKYAKEVKRERGELFVTRKGNGLSRKQIWQEMKQLCDKAGVETSKVFPHNLRHLFATVYYQASRDIVKLADVLGHGSIETTRIYLLSTGTEHLRQLEELELIL